MTRRDLDFVADLVETQKLLRLAKYPGDDVMYLTKLLQPPNHLMESMLRSVSQENK